MDSWLNIFAIVLQAGQALTSRSNRLDERLRSTPVTLRVLDSPPFLIADFQK